MILTTLPLWTIQGKLDAEVVVTFSKFLYLTTGFPDCRQWLEDALKENDPTSVQLFLVGTKKDLSVRPLLCRVDVCAGCSCCFYWSGASSTEAVSGVRPQECFPSFTGPQNISARLLEIQIFMHISIPFSICDVAPVKGLHLNVIVGPGFNQFVALKILRYMVSSDLKQ